MACGIGLATGRPDIVALGAPLLLGWWAALIVARPMIGSDGPRARASLGAPAAGSADMDLTVEVAGLDGVELALVAQPSADGDPIGALEAVPGGPGSAVLRRRYHPEKWGETDVARPDTLGIGPDGLYTAGPVRQAETLREVVLPEVEAVDPLVLPPILGGWAGAHLSRRSGQGSDLVDLREFAPGDRLRSIHWRAYARHQRLYTRRTMSDADAEIMVCVDLSTHLAPRTPESAVGPLARVVAALSAAFRRVRDRLADLRDAEGAQRREESRRALTRSSLDHAVRAAAAISSAHLRQGDRVGLMVAAVPRHHVRPGTGTRQMRRIRYQLALLDDRRRRLLDVAWWGLRPGQTVVWCSPMASPPSFDAAIACHERGHRVIVVDTAPLTGILTHADRPDIDHLRVLTVERELRFDRLRGRGIPVVCWDSGDIAAQLARATRAMGRRT